MSKKKIWLVIGIIITILLITGTFFITKQMYYEKGKVDQSVIMMDILISFGMNCQPIDIPLGENNKIQLVNPECYT